MIDDIHTTFNGITSRKIVSQPYRLNVYQLACHPGPIFLVKRQSLQKDQGIVGCTPTNVPIWEIRI